MYVDQYNGTITKKLIKIKKKDPKHYLIVRKKMDWIINNPKHNYKNLHYSMKFLKRIHIGHFVLVFGIDNVKKIILFEDYDHHDKIYN